MELKTKEPITITLTESNYGDSSVLIQIGDETGTYDYAVFDGVDLETIDLDDTRVWVEETYYSLCYRSDAYVCGHYNKYPKN